MAAHDDDMNRGIRPGRGSDDPAGQIAYLEQEIAVLRRKLADSPRHTRILEERIVELQTSLAGVSAQNERLANTLREARDQIVALKEEVDRLAQPPAGFGVYLQANEDGTADIFTGGRKLRVNVSPSVELEDLRRVLGTDPVPSTEILVDPDLEGLAVAWGLLLHGHFSCRFLRRAIRRLGNRASSDGC